MERVFRFQTVEHLRGLSNALVKAGFAVRNVGLDSRGTYVYLQEKETKNPIPAIQAWFGKPISVEEVGPVVAKKELQEKIDIFMPTCNRLEYVKISLESLFETTEPTLVNQLIIVDATSEDGTASFLSERLKQKTPFKCQIITIKERHIVHSMKAARDAAQTGIVAKIDSDSVPCPGWLPLCLDVMRRNPKLWALGIPPRTANVVHPKSNEERSYNPAEYVGGVGLFRRDAWNGIQAEKAPYWGWTSHQVNNPWGKGWLIPDLPVILLDQLPFEPFISLRKKYFDCGWHRTKGSQKPAQSAIWKWKFPEWEKGLPG